ncbi:hypothetical protein FRC02_002610 [Tulasnella sp. 418]|nr:hypothetical protein FRC02_002610 [Tulasnella sp. 418]
MALIPSIRASAAEISAGRLTLQHVQKALEALHRDGIVVIENAIKHENINKLNERMVEEAKLLRDRPNSPFNYVRGNIQQDPPPEPAYFFKDIFVNPFAVQLSNSFLGPRPKMTFCSGNTALHSTERQPVHTDADFDHPKIPFALVINQGLTDMTPEKGSTEIWLGTQNMAGLEAQDGAHGERASGRIKPHLLKERKSVSPPIQPTIPKGSVVLRDLRLWHAGMPNKSDEIRVMLAQIHFAHWYRNQMKLEFPKGMEEALRHPDLEIPTRFVDPPINHMDRAFGNAYNFNQTD